MFGLFRRRRPAPVARFFERFAGRSIIVHRGFEDDWLERLLKLPGGGGYFRLDLRQDAGAASPLEQVVQAHVLPLELPLPLILRVAADEVLVRHLSRAGGGTLDPSEIGWLLDEIEARHHARLRRQGDTLATERGIDPADNRIEYDFSDFTLE